MDTLPKMAPPVSDEPEEPEEPDEPIDEMLGGPLPMRKVSHLRIIEREFNLPEEPLEGLTEEELDELIQNRLMGNRLEGLVRTAQGLLTATAGLVEQADPEVEGFLADMEAHLQQPETICNLRMIMLENFDFMTRYLGPMTCMTINVGAIYWKRKKLAHSSNASRRDGKGK